MKVPDVKRCCFCFPLRWGIVVFAVINTVLSIITMARLLIVTEKHEVLIVSRSNYELMFLILAGVAIILSILMLVGGYQKDLSLLRLYNSYATAMVVVILIQTVLLFCKYLLKEASIGLFISAMQVYLILLVRSDIIKLENKQATEGRSTECAVDVPDRVTLL